MYHAAERGGGKLPSAVQVRGGEKGGIEGVDLELVVR